MPDEQVETDEVGLVDAQAGGGRLTDQVDRDAQVEQLVGERLGKGTGWASPKFFNELISKSLDYHLI